MTRKEVLKITREKDVKFIKLWFTDILGFLKSFAITVEELKDALAEGMGFDGSSIEGFARIDESDMVALPDPSTFTILPWRSQEKGTARMFCDIKNPDGSAYEGDPRYALKKNLQRAKKMGFTFYVGPELEYFYFASSLDTKPLDSGGYFDLIPFDEGLDLRRETILALQQMDIPVEYSHHEVAPSQHEIDLKFGEALIMADRTMTYRFVVKQIAHQKGIYATFMPKPVFGVNGSGMHTHQSLFKGKKNAFFNPRDKYHLSGTGKSFIAGVMKHAPEFTLVTNQWVNSYKRLVPGYEAPAYVSWAQRNRSDLIRIPMYKPGKEVSTRMELRSPDPACNPYLAFSVMLASGLEGIEKKYKLEEPVEENIYQMGEKKRKRRGIKSLPGSLSEAIEITEKSQLVKKALGEHIFNKLIENKKMEWNNYRAQVTSYELEKYLPIL